MSSLPTTSGTHLREPLIARPLIVLGAPRSGTTMVFQALSTHPDVWSLYRESQAVIGRFFPTEMTPGSPVLVCAGDVDDVTAAAIRTAPSTSRWATPRRRTVPWAGASPSSPGSA